MMRRLWMGIATILIVVAAAGCRLDAEDASSMPASTTPIPGASGSPEVPLAPPHDIGSPDPPATVQPIAPP